MAAAFTFDRIDRRILEVLQSDGRITNQALAERVHLSPSACIARVRRLEASGAILGYGAWLDPWSLDIGVILYAEIWLGDQNPVGLERFESAIAALPQIVEATYVSGAFDYLVKAVVADMRAWTQLSEDLIAGDLGVERIVTHVLMKKTKPFRGYPVTKP